MTDLTPAQYALAETATDAFKRGVAARQANDLAAARQAWALAAAAYDELISDGATQFRPDRAHTLMNWGNALASSGDLPGALARYAEAKTAYDELIDDGATQFRPDLADTLMGWGNALQSSGDLPGALTRYAQAKTAYDELIDDGATQFRPNRAKTLMNWGVALASSGDLPGALARFAEAKTAYDELIGEGSMQFRANRAVTLMNWGNVLQSIGDRFGALARYAEALDVWAALLREKQRQHADNVLTAVTNQLLCAQQQAREGHRLDAVQTLVMFEAMKAQVGEVTTAVLALDLPVLLDERLQTLLGAVETMASRTLPEPSRERWAQFRVYLAHIITAGAARWLRDAPPSQLATQRDQTDALVERVRQLALVCASEHAEGKSLPAQWMVQTRGLRAMRAALVASSDPELQSLAALYAELDRLTIEYATTVARQNAHQRDAANKADGAGEISGTRELVGPALATQDNAAGNGLSARIDALQQRIERAVLTLQRQNRLRSDFNSRQVLDVEALSLRLRPGQAWLGLARVSPQRLMLTVVLRRPGGDDGGVQTFWREPELGANAFTDCAVLLHAAEKSAPNPRGVRREGPSVGNAQAAMSADAAAVALAVTVAPVLAVLDQLSQLGVTQVDVVPSGDLHWIAWAHVATQHASRWRGKLRVYPTTVDWWRAQPAEVNTETHPSAASGIESLSPPQWASLGYGADDSSHVQVLARYLPFVALELALAKKIWTARSGAAAMQALPREAPAWPRRAAIAAGHTADANDDVIAALDVKTPGPVDALLGAGHGHQAQTDAAGTGLMVGLTPVAHASGGEPLPKTFGAHDLPQIQRVRRLLLSCCTLGRTESVLGEALGMAATAFAYDTRWAVGYLIPVGDLEATLFSAALQWGIAQLPDEQYADDAAWRAVFEHTRETIHEGRWPDGVGAFLREVLPTALAHAAPSTARTSAPWRKQWAAAVCDYAAMLNVDDRGRAWAREEGEALTAALAELAARLAACPPKSLVAMMPWVICLGG